MNEKEHICDFIPEKLSIVPEDSDNFVPLKYYQKGIFITIGPKYCPYCGKSIKEIQTD